MPEQMDVTKLEAGRELDELVALAMGWQRDLVAVAGGFRVVWWPPSEDAVPEYVPLPPYSTDIAAAWLVVESWKELRGGHSRFSIEWGSDDWRVEVWANYGGDSVVVYHPSLPLAICRADLEVARFNA
jgi:hypothetical protein